MSANTDIVIQGGMWDQTYDIALDYCELDFVNRVIISTWETEKDKIAKYPDHPNIVWVVNKFPDNPGPSYSDGRPGNINLAIISSRSGIEATTSPVVVKIRSDMHISSDGMQTLNKFYKKFSRIPRINCEYLKKPSSQIFALGVNSAWPYCPHDQVFWGERQDLVDLFSLPLAEADHPMAKAVPVFRPEIYIGAHYYARFNELVGEHLNDPRTYLIDDAPRFGEALRHSTTLGHELFKPFPRVDMNWVKYNSGFMYDMYEAQGAIYYNDAWESSEVDCELHDTVLHNMNTAMSQYSEGNNKLHKPDNDHWDAFNDDYFKLISDPYSWNNFRRNGVTCMLETGLYARDRKDYIKNRRLYPEYYSDAEVAEIKTRLSELISMAGKDFVDNFTECETGSPRHCVINDEKYNFDDIYNVYALWQIQRSLSKIKCKPDIILEIGAGYGGLCNKLLDMYPSSKYVILDLPESLAVQHYNLATIDPEKKIVSLKDFKDEKDIAHFLSNEHYDVALVPCWYGDKIKSLKTDLIINMRSLGEMTEDLLHYYFDIIQSSLKKRGVFYCVNRYVFTSSNHKLKLKDYPFDEDWTFIISQPQWLQTHLHEWVALRERDKNVSPSFILESLSERMPPPGPIMEDILPQKKWIENNVKS
jgi:putative sugar O-methyltransferase